MLCKIKKNSVIFVSNFFQSMLVKKKKVNIITLGCSKNLVDSEMLSGQLKYGPYEVIHDSDENADIVIINTCGFIHDAKEQSVQTILEQVQLREEGKIEKLIVTGCLSERYKKELPAEIPEVDAYFGNHHLKDILNYLKVDFKKELIGERLLATPPHYAYLKISEGCDRKCAFCAIPLIRGAHKSVPMEQLVAQAEKLASQGVKELMLIAQDLTFYGLDIYGKRQLAQLLKKLSRVDGIQWIRLHYMYPAGFPDDVLDIMRDEPKVCNYVDIPLQHIDDEILRSMNRGAGEKQTRKLIRKIKERIPDVHIRTTFIVGYPGETEEKFEKLTDFVKEMEFDRVGVFTYSHEEDTPAYKLTDHIPEQIKEERKNRLLDLQTEISKRKNQAKIGKTMPVIIDARYGNEYLTRTEFDSPEVDNEVHIITDRLLTPGKFAEVKIIDADAFDLWGELI